MRIPLPTFLNFKADLIKNQPHIFPKKDPPTLLPTHSLSLIGDNQVVAEPLWNKLKLSLCLIKMNTYGEVEVLFQAFLTLAIDGGEWSVSHIAHFIPSKTPLVLSIG
jgi:hypothetical protein